VAKSIDDRKFEKVEGAAIASTVSLYFIGADAEKLAATLQFFKLTEYILSRKFKDFYRITV
jgi:hypothetical protein